MPFTNPPVPLETLPDYATVKLNSVVPKYLLYALISAAWFWPLLAVLSLLGEYIPGVKAVAGPWLTGGLLALTLPALLHSWLDARRRGWALREHDLIYRSGVLWRRTIILPFTRIQHVETANGPLERLFGLMRVKCFTAGGTAADLTVLGLDAEQARRIRQYLLEQISEDGADDDRQ